MNRYSQKGQVILILVLVMTVALAIGISVIQRSLSDVSTASKVEQSSRAFSAAEAGIEKAIQANRSFASPIPLDNNSSIDNVDKKDIPVGSNALEYPPISKEEMAQVWLADPVTLNPSYTQPSFNIYFGRPDTTSDKPAIEVTVISWDGTNYVATKKFLDSDSVRASANGFTPASCASPASVVTNANAIGNESKFYCTANVSGYPYNGSSKVVLARIRLLYSSISQPVALEPVSGSLPTQAKIFTSTGISGTTQRKVQVFRLDKVVPPYFDYAIFSMGIINK